MNFHSIDDLYFKFLFICIVKSNNDDEFKI